MSPALQNLIQTSLRFMDRAAAEGIEIDGIRPDEALSDYYDAAGLDDWHSIEAHAMGELLSIRTPEAMLDLRDRYLSGTDVSNEEQQRMNDQMGGVA